MALGGSHTTLGQKYFMGIQMALCHYPIDAIQEIRAGDVTIYDTPVTSSDTIAIDEPYAFGGERQEGGIVGDVDLAFGEPAQTENTYLQSVLGSTIPAFRGVVCAILNQVYVASMVANIKPWSFLVQWLDSHACGPNSLDMNPAHIIELALTEKWGLGQSSGDLNTDSFTATSTTLGTEELGLSLAWMSSNPVQDLLADVLQHIMGVLYTDPETGKFVLKLMRQTDTSVLTLDESNVVEVVNYQRPSLSELVNEVVLHYRDREERDQIITLHNQGLIEQMGGVINSRDLYYDMVVEPATAQKMAARDLRNLSTPLSTGELIVNRTALAVRLGDVCSFAWPRYGVTAEDVRVIWIEYGTLQDGSIRLQVIQDIYGVDDAQYSTAPATKWTDPENDPAASPYRMLFEVPYYLLVQRFSETGSLWDEIDNDAGWVIAAIQKPSGDASSYELWARDYDPYEEKVEASFPPIGTLAGAITPEVTTNTTYVEVFDTDLVTLETYCILEAEFCEVTAIDSEAGTLTLKRGVLDTVPQAHALGTRLYFADTWTGEDPTEYYSGVTVYIKCLPTTAKGTLLIASAPEDTVTMDDRMYRPYPPGKFQLNAQYYPAYIVGALTTTWAHRDRLTQTAGFIAQSAGDIGPEATTTYTLKIYNENSVLQKTLTGQAGTSFAYAIADEITDASLPGARPNESMRIVLYSVRDAFDSWQAQDFTILECIGYGMFYGEYYGE